MPEAESDRAAGAVDRPAIEILALKWERIQLIVRARSIARPLLEARDLRLQPDGTDRAPMPPTHAATHGDELFLRWNVMQGPGQQPLTSGRWTMVAASSDGPAPVRIADPQAVDTRATRAEFALARGTYSVQPVIDPVESALALDVRLTPSSVSGTAVLGAWRPWRRVTRVRTVRRAAFRLMFELNRLLHRRNGRRILFTSDSREALGGNLQVVHDRMVERGLDRRYRLLTLFKPSIAADRSWRDRLRLPRLLAAADVIVLDDYQPAIYQLRPGSEPRIVQLWHASGAFKTVGYSRVGKPGGPSPYSRVHKNYTHAIVSSDFDVPFYAEAFGIPEARVIPTGIPRMDRFFDEAARAEGRERAHAEFPETEGRTTILFAPTFRGNGPRDAFYDYALLNFRRLHALAVEKDAVVIMRMHPFVAEPPPIPEELRDRIIDGSRAEIDVNDLLFAVDLLITDYSSIVFEYSTLGRPMLFFAYDLEEYVATRDFYVPFEEFVPGRIVRTFDELLDAVQRDDYHLEKVASFAARHFDHLDGTSTDRVIDELILRR
jgi:CDP-glycerol glycerophosphotransferase (TagB/SpsB family)